MEVSCFFHTYVKLESYMRTIACTIAVEIFIMISRNVFVNCTGMLSTGLYWWQMLVIAGLYSHEEELLGKCLKTTGLAVRERG